MLDRKSCKKYWVWTDDKEDKEQRIVIDARKDGSCDTVFEDDEYYFYNNEAYCVVEYDHYEEIKEPETRLMTRNEVLDFILDNPKIYVKRVPVGDKSLPQYWDYSLNIDEYRYCHKGEDVWHKFEIEEEAE